MKAWSEVVEELMAIYDDSMTTIDMDLRSDQLQRVLAVAQPMADREPDNVACNYLVANCWYSMPGEPTERQEAILEHLGRVLRADSEHAYAHMRLANFYFDMERYDEAQSELEKINWNRIQEAGRLWRRNHADQMILCCRLYRDDADLSAGEVHAFLERTRQRSGTSESLEPIRELVECFAAVLDRPAMAAIVRGCTPALLETILLMGDVRVLAEPIARLRARVNRG